MYRTSALIRALGMTGLALALFGGLWMLEALNTFTWIWVVCCVLVPTVLLVMRAIGLLLAGREAREAEPAETAEEAAGRRGLERRLRWYLLSGILLIVVAVNVLMTSGHGDWILAVIAGIVGVHVLPLGRVFRFAAYYLTGGAELAATAVLAWLARGRITAADPIFGLIMGLALWLTVILLLLQGARVAGRVSRAEPTAEA